MFIPTQKILKAFGKIVKERRLALNLTQESFSELCELDRTYISGIERGLRNISLTAIVKIATSLQTTSAKLLQDLERNAQQHDEVN